MEYFGNKVATVRLSNICQATLRLYSKIGDESRQLVQSTSIYGVET